MSVRDHTEIEELLAVQALGGLEDDERAQLEAAMAAHGPDCAECRRLQAGFEETAAMLAFSLEPAEVESDEADRVLAAAAATTRDGAATRPSPAGPDQLAERRERRSRGTWRVVVGIAAAFVLLAVVAVVRSTGGDTVTTTWAQRVVPFEGDGGGELAMAYTPGTSGVVIWGEGLPDPGPGNVYELWMITGDTPVSGGCLSPTDGSLAGFVDADVSTADVMAVTVEPEACPSAPTSAPVRIATLA
jgi:anti-sigma-K factor RskA